MKLGMIIRIKILRDKIVIYVIKKLFSDYNKLKKYNIKFKY
jgi:hypothetical protein